MKKKQFLRPSAGVLSCCTAASLAFAALSPQTAGAADPGSAANAKILNVVTVTYYDATGANKHQAATSTSVTVALKQAALTVATQVPFSAVDSGSTATSYVALTANANGPDQYKVTLSDTTANLSSNTIATGVVADPIDSAAITAFSSGGSVTLGATSIISAGTPGSTQVLTVPAGTLNGIAKDSTIVIGGISYKVIDTTAGTQAGYTVTGPSTGTGQKTDETPGTITIGIDPNGSKVTPNITGTVAGTIIAERKYLRIDDKGIVSSNTADGTDDVTVSTASSGATYTADLAAADIATFYHVQVSIDKSVANVTTPASPAGTGKPGDILEYTVLVSNATQGNAGEVSVTDTVPDYTTLVSGSSYGALDGNGAATEKFATISDGSSTVDVTLDTTDSEPANTNIGFGGATGTAAGKAITFYLGTGSSNNAGGTVAATKSYTIKYRVKIN